MKKQNGFTLLELIITIVILGIMASIAVPSYSAFITKNRQSSVYNNLVGTISLARLEAVKRSQVVTLCISTDQATCAATTATNWGSGWIVFADINGNGLVDTTSDPDTTDTVLKVEPATVSNITISSSDFGSLLSIAPRGRLRTQGSIVICSSESAEEGMALNLWVTGLGRLATDSNDDGIVEKIDGSNISCSSDTDSDSD